MAMVACPMPQGRQHNALSAVGKRINPETNLPKFQRKCDSNLEEPIVAATELYWEALIHLS